jgi:hypothetical protein
MVEQPSESSRYSARFSPWNGRQTIRIRDAVGDVVVRVEWSAFSTVPKRIRIGGRKYRRERFRRHVPASAVESGTPSTVGDERGRSARRWAVVDLGTGHTVATIAGRHSYRAADGTLTLVDGTAIAFPVENRVMTAQDVAGGLLAQFHRVDPYGPISRARHRRSSLWAGAEIVVPSNSLEGDDLGLVLGVGAVFFRNYFRSGGA